LNSCPLDFASAFFLFVRCQCRLVILKIGGVTIEDFSLVTRIDFQGFAAHPHFCRRTAPVGLNQAHRHRAGIQQIPSEKVADGAETLDRVGRTGLPCRVETNRRRVGLHVWDVEETNQCVGGQCDGRLRLKRLAHRQFHVGLAAADPDFPNQDVGKLEGAPFGADRKDIRSARLEAAKAHGPLPF